jgi:hypothetical protein
MCRLMVSSYPGTDFGHSSSRFRASTRLLQEFPVHVDFGRLNSLPTEFSSSLGGDLYTMGMPIGTAMSWISASPMLPLVLTQPLRVLACATTRTFRPSMSSYTILFGIVLSIQSSKDSVSGICSLVRSSYFPSTSYIVGIILCHRWRTCSQRISLLLDQV